jgi:hypothetical protein
MARTRTDAPQEVIDAPPLNLDELATSAVETTVHSGGGRFLNNPFIPILRESYKIDSEGGNGWRANRVTGAQVREFVSALRNAAQQLADDDIGIRIKYEFRNDENEVVELGNVKLVPEDARAVNVKYIGRPRKVYARDASENGEGESNGDGDHPEEVAEEDETNE